MSRRVDHHPPSVRRRLLDSPDGPKGQGRRFGSVEVVHGQVQMDLLWAAGLLRPVRSAVVRDAHRRDPHSVGAHSNEIVTPKGHFTAQEIGPEVTQSRRIVAVEGDRTQSNFGHGTMVTRRGRPPAALASAALASAPGLCCLGLCRPGLCCPGLCRPGLCCPGLCCPGLCCPGLRPCGQPTLRRSTTNTRVSLAAMPEPGEDDP